MASVIEQASSGRAKCRVCGQAIAKGEQRFGEALPNSYGEGESLFWFHLRCAACCRPESLLAALDEGQGAQAASAELRALAQAGVAEPRLSRILRAERASSGRARCRHCRELIAQGDWRLALQIFEEGRFNAMGSIHASCAVHYFGVEPELERLTLPSNQLDSEDLTAVVASMREGGAARPLQPGLAKAAGEQPSLDSARKSS
jgi:poly(ADP-ribose) polymerase-like protein